MKESAAAEVKLVQFEMKPEKKKSTGSRSLTGAKKDLQWLAQKLDFLAISSINEPFSQRLKTT